MTRTTSFAATLVLLLSSLAARAQDAEDRRYEIGDLARVPLAREHLRLGLDRAGDASYFAVRGLNRGDEAGEDGRGIRTDALQTRIQDWIDPGTWEGENSIRQAGRALVIRHSPATHARVAEFLASLRARIHRQIRLEVSIYEGAAAAADEIVVGGAILDAARVAALAGPGWRLESTTRVACPTGHHRMVAIAEDGTFVRDWDAAAAEGVASIDPEIARFTTGEVVVVEPCLSHDAERLAIRCLYQRTHERLPRSMLTWAMRTRSGGIDAIESIAFEQPRLDTRGWGTHVRMPAGGSALVGVVGTGTSVRVLVVRHLADQAERPVPTSAGVPTWFDVRYLTKLDDHLFGASTQDHNAPPVASGADPVDESEEVGEWSIDSFLEWTKSSIAPASWESEHAGLATLGGGLVVRNTPDVLAAMAKAVREAEIRQGSMWLVRVRLLAGPADGLADVAGLSGRSLGETDRAAVTALLRGKPEVVAADLAVGGPPNRWVSAIDGSETTFVADYSVAAAKDASILDPEVHSLVVGTSLSACAVPIDGAHWLVKLRLDHAELVEMETLAAYKGVELQRPRTRRFDRTFELPLPARGSQIVDLGRGTYLLVELCAPEAK